MYHCLTSSTTARPREEALFSSITEFTRPLAWPEGGGKGGADTPLWDHMHTITHRRLNITDNLR